MLSTFTLFLLPQRDYCDQRHNLVPESMKIYLWMKSRLSSKASARSFPFGEKMKLSSQCTEWVSSSSLTWDHLLYCIPVKLVSNQELLDLIEADWLKKINSQMGLLTLILCMAVFFIYTLSFLSLLLLSWTDYCPQNYRPVPETGNASLGKITGLVSQGGYLPQIEASIWSSTQKPPLCCHLASFYRHQWMLLLV